MCLLPFFLLVPLSMEGNYFPTFRQVLILRDVLHMYFMSQNNYIDH